MEGIRPGAVVRYAINPNHIAVVKPVDQLISKREEGILISPPINTSIALPVDYHWNDYEVYKTGVKLVSLC